MNYKKILNKITVFLLLSALASALIYFWDAPLKDTMVAIAAYLLRFGLIFLGVFAAYRILQERHKAQSIV